jgi:hypothetical protein
MGAKSKLVDAAQQKRFWLVIVIFVFALVAWERNSRSAEHEATIAEHEATIAELNAKLSVLEGRSSVIADLKANIANEAEMSKQAGTIAELEAKITELKENCQKSEEEGVSRAKLYEMGQQVFDYENVVPNYEKIDEHKHRYAKLPEGMIDFRPDAMKKLYQDLLPYDSEYTDHHRNEMYYRRESVTLYAMIRHFKPKQMVEVGSGFSTVAAHKALKKNGGELKHVVIEPFRNNVVLEMVGADEITLKQQTIQEVDMSFFKNLNAGDLLFIDSSHVTQPYGDTILELIFILPLLPKGCIVHIHDIYLPFDYRVKGAPWPEKEHYTEQWVLAAFLHGNTKWEVLWSAIYLENEVSSTFFDGGFGGRDMDSAAIYIRKIAD